MIKEIKDKIEKTKGKINIGFGVPFSQYETLKRIYHYQNSRHLSDEIDPVTNKKKPFPNISRFRARIVAKMLDFDMKDIRVVSNRLDLISQFKSFLLERAIKNWAKENDFGFLLNEIVSNVSSYGSCIVMKLKGQMPEIIDLKSIYFNQDIDYIQDAPFIILEREFFKEELNKKKDIWDNVDIILNNIEDKIKIYFYFGYFDGERMIKIYSDAIKGYKDGLLLYEQKIDKFPFVDFHINKIKGRWLGVGTYEELFEPQIRMLTVSGLRARAIEFASKLLFQTNEKTAYKNLGTDVESGDVIFGQFSPIQTESRGITEFRDEESFWTALSDRLTFTYDVIRGESLPATTPATNATIQAQMATSTFEMLRENLAFQIIKFIKDYVLEDVKKEFKKEFILKIVNSVDDINKFDEFFAKIKKGEYIYKYLNSTGFYPENTEAIEKNVLAELKEFGLLRTIKIPDRFFDDLEDIDIIIDAEARNVPLEANNLNTLIQILASNPQALEVPLIKSLVYSYSEKIGVSPIELEAVKGRELKQQNENIGITQAGLPAALAEQGLGIGSGAVGRTPEQNI